MRWIYTLLLRENKYYVGFTENLEQRMVAHFTGEGAKWTQVYKPIKIIEVVPEIHDWHEDFVTLVMMKKHGINNVRGGNWCQTQPLTVNPVNYDKIDPDKSLEENLILVSKNNMIFNFLPKEDDILNLFRQGKNEFEISQICNISMLQVESYIVKLVKSGKIKTNEIGLTENKIMNINKIINKGKTQAISIKNFCDNSVTMKDIRYFFALFHYKQI